MKSNLKTKTIFLMILGIIFVLSPIINSNLNFNAGNSDKSSEYSDGINFDNENLEISKMSGKIHIWNNWSGAKTAGICTGSGTYSNPYIIEDLVIDGGGSGNGIWIENSAVYFKIENCTLYNSGEGWGDAGINLYNVDNGQLINNTTNNNGLNGILLTASNYNKISGNTASNNNIGIYLWDSDNNNILGNTASNNDVYGMALWYAHNSIISENMVENNEGGIYLWNSNNNTVSGNTANNNTMAGIYLDENESNTVSGNIANNNHDGIYLRNSDRNIIELNTISYNSVGIYLDELSLCNEVFDNSFSSNGEDIQNFQGVCINENLFPLVIGIILVTVCIMIIAGMLIIRRKKNRGIEIALKPLARDDRKIEVEKKSIDYEKNKQWFRRLGAINIIFIIVFIISAFLPIYYYWPLGISYIYGGLEGFIFIIISTIFAFHTKRNKAIVSGALGCVLIGFNSISLFRIYYNPGVILFLISLIGFCAVTVGLYHFTEKIKEAIIKSKKLEMLEEEIVVIEKLEPQEKLKPQKVVIEKNEKPELEEIEIIKREKEEKERWAREKREREEKEKKEREARERKTGKGNN